MKFTATPPKQSVRKLNNAGAQYRKDLRAAAYLATDRASKDGQKEVQLRIRSVGLGRLGGAVGHTSAKRKGDRTGDPYGVIFARGGDESSGGGALEAYSRGATITPRVPDGWLWIPQRSIPRFVSFAGRRFRTTPALYNRSGLVSSIGPLVFKPISGRRALLVIRKASVNIKSGRAKTPNKRKSKTSTFEKDVIAFIGIKVTRRAARFDHKAIMLQKARQMPEYLTVALDEVQRGRQ